MKAIKYGLPTHSVVIFAIGCGLMIYKTSWDVAVGVIIMVAGVAEGLGCMIFELINKADEMAWKYQSLEHKIESMEQYFSMTDGESG